MATIPSPAECLSYQCGAPGTVDRKVLCGEYGMAGAKDPCGDPECAPYLSLWLAYAGPYACGGYPISPSAYRGSPASGYTSDWQSGLLGPRYNGMPSIGGCGCCGTSNNPIGGGSIPSGPAIPGPLGTATGPVTPDGSVFAFDVAAGFSWLWLIVIVLILIFANRKKKS